MSSKNQTRLALSRTTVGEEDNSDHEDNGPSYEDLVDYSLELEKQLVEAEDEIAKLKSALPRQGSASKLPPISSSASLPSKDIETQAEMKRLRDEVLHWKQLTQERDVLIHSLRYQLAEVQVKYQVACDIQQVNLSTMNVAFQQMVPPSPKASTNPSPRASVPVLVKSPSNQLTKSLSRPSLTHSTSKAQMALMTSPSGKHLPPLGTTMSSRPSSSQGSTTTTTAH